MWILITKWFLVIITFGILSGVLFNEDDED
jgi:hypothetical protein